MSHGLILGKEHALKRKKNPRISGMTLVEIMIVVVIMAMIATGVGAAVIPQMMRARVKQARIDASSIRAAAEQLLLSGDQVECPTVEDLHQAGMLRGRQVQTVDPWGNAFVVSCATDEVGVTSAGSDGAFGTEDDVI